MSSRHWEEVEKQPDPQSNPSLDAGRWSAPRTSHFGPGNKVSAFLRGDWVSLGISQNLYGYSRPAFTLC
jgi:hypothetical protein